MLESSWLGFRQAQWLSFEEVREGTHLAKILASPLMKPLLLSLFTQSTNIAQLNAQALSRIIVLARPQRSWSGDYSQGEQESVG